MAHHLAQIQISVYAFLVACAGPILPERSTAITVMTASQEESYTSAALFVSAAYYRPRPPQYGPVEVMLLASLCLTISAYAPWPLACCDALPGFGSGGDGSIAQYCSPRLLLSVCS